MRRAQDNRQDSRQDNRIPPQKWWRLALATLLTFGLVTALTGSGTPLTDGWPLIAVLFALAAIRQGADLYGHYERRRGGLGRRHAPHV